MGNVLELDLLLHLARTRAGHGRRAPRTALAAFAFNERARLRRPVRHEPQAAGIRMQLGRPPRSRGPHAYGDAARFVSVGRFVQRSELVRLLVRSADHRSRKRRRGDPLGRASHYTRRTPDHRVQHAGNRHRQRVLPAAVVSARSGCTLSDGRTSRCGNVAVHAQAEHRADRTPALRRSRRPRRAPFRPQAPPHHDAQGAAGDRGHIAVLRPFIRTHERLLRAEQRQPHHGARLPQHRGAHPGGYRHPRHHQRVPDGFPAHDLPGRLAAHGGGLHLLLAHLPARPHRVRAASDGLPVLLHHHLGAMGAAGA